MRKATFIAALAALLAAAVPVQADNPTRLGNRLAISGDIADCNRPGDTATAALVQEELDARPNLGVVIVGDAVYNDGTLTEYRECFDPNWGAFKDRTVYAPGNHDRNRVGANQYWGLDPGDDVWVFDIGSKWLGVALDSEAYNDASSSQRRGMRDQIETALDESGRKCAVFFSHHPRYSSGKHGDKNWMDPVWDLLVDQGKTKIVVAGHDHHYERIRKNGIHLFISGHGGKSHYPQGTVHANSQKRVFGPANNHNNLDKYGVLVLDLWKGKYKWRYESVGNGRMDSGQKAVDCVI